MTEQQIYHHNVPGGAVAYAWSHEPTSTPLVILHGLGDSAIHTFWPRLTTGPLSTTPTLFVDIPGFGESRYMPQHPATIGRYAQDIASLLAALRVKQAHVFGHSMGGNIAIRLTSMYPALVDRLIVAEPLLLRAQSVMAADIARFDEGTFINRRFPMLVRATSLQAHRGDLSAAVFLASLQLANPIAMHRAACSLIADARSAAAVLTGTIRTPRTFLMGQNTIGETAELESAGISVIRVPNAGHNMIVDQALATTCAILEATI